MGKTRKMRLVAFLKTGPTTHHHGMWRHPETDNDFLDPAWDEHVARVLEKGKFDCLFFADTLGLFDAYRGNFVAILRGGGQMGFLDPLPVLAVMSRVTPSLHGRPSVKPSRRYRRRLASYMKDAMDSGAGPPSLSDPRIELVIPEASIRLKVGDGRLHHR